VQTTRCLLGGRAHSKYKGPHWFDRLATILVVMVIWTGSGTAHTQTPEPSCIQSSAPGGQIRPTRVFHTVNPIHPIRTLANPLNPGVNTAISMISLGDSAIWGNGLVNDHKYSHEIAQSVANATGRSITLFSYAHSGANLSREAGSAYGPITGSDINVPPGDLNAGLPTTIQQEACAAKEHSETEIVLLDGCINDVSAEAIALPFPLSRVPAGEIAQRAHDQCSNGVPRIQWRPLRRRLMTASNSSGLTPPRWLCRRLLL
jgi:hypothetical protein